MLPTQCATWLSTDIEGSTRLWEERGQVMKRHLAEHDRIVRAIAAAEGGREVRAEGDSFTIASLHADHALAAATHIRRELRQRVPLKVRMGLHACSVERGSEYAHGPAILTASRVRDAASGGQILVTRQVMEQLDSLRWTQEQFLTHGDHRLAGILEPMAIYELLPEPGEPVCPPPRSLSAALTKLLVRSAPFFGRAKEWRQAVEWLGSSRPDVLPSDTFFGGRGAHKLRSGWLSAGNRTCRVSPEGDVA